MASQHPARGYDEITLLALEQALKDVWQVLRAHDFYRDWDRDPVLKKRFSTNVDGLSRHRCAQPTGTSQAHACDSGFRSVALELRGAGRSPGGGYAGASPVPLGEPMTGRSNRHH